VRGDWLQLRPWKRHSRVVGIGGLVYLLYGIAFAIVPLTPERASTFRVAFHLLPAPFWAGCWILTGSLALASTRWPPASETWGYTALSALSALWGLFYGTGILAGAPAAGINGCLVWFLVAALWWGIAGLQNPDGIPNPE
jgi:hypothetical protein